jgi:hypothetical protein
MRIGLVVLTTISLLQAGELKLGKPLVEKSQTSLNELVAKPATYVGKTVQVSGKITEVCQAMGCWIMITDGKDARIRIQLAEEGKVAFPKDAPGKSVIAEGKVVRFELTKEQAVAMAKHEAKDAGRPFNPESVKTPYVYYQIEGSGAVLTDDGA